MWTDLFSSSPPLQQFNSDFFFSIYIHTQSAMPRLALTQCELCNRISQHFLLPLPNLISLNKILFKVSKITKFHIKSSTDLYKLLLSENSFHSTFQYTHYSSSIYSNVKSLLLITAKCTCFHERTRASSQHDQNPSKSCHLCSYEFQEREFSNVPEVCYNDTIYKVRHV